MNYLERNKLLIEEIRKLNLKVGKEIARNESESRQMIVYSLGSYQSNVLGKELHLVLKEKESINRHLHSVVSRELGLIRAIELRFPHLLLEFPLVHGVVIGIDEKYKGTLSEDFTEGGKYKIAPEYEFPSELSNAFGHHIDDQDMATTSFFVNGRRRIGDLEEFYGGIGASKREDIIPAHDILAKLNDFTVRID